MERVCFLLRVRPEMAEEYKARHRDVWVDLLQALVDTGWGNYSLFLHEDGLLIGYFETENLAASLEGMASKEVNTRWQAEMSGYFLELDGTPPDRGFIRLEEVFNLQMQVTKTYGIESH